MTLLSGGLDSSIVLALAIRRGYRTYALTVNYGQRHQVELEAARRVAKALGAFKHLELSLDLRAIGGSSLTADIAVPKDRGEDEMSADTPITYVPARNTILLALALSWAETLGARAIFIGVNAVDYSGYPDCRPEFIKAFERTANLATKAGIEGREFTIETPLLNLKKSEIIRLGLELGVDFSLTHSCYDPSPEGLACGSCDSCLWRRRGFQEAGVPDPTRYAQ
ncbi:MAG: 7-cyano-7-deazaguanine synthase QueC [Calditrichota bacterium]